jgi:type I restriction-modification system DNA methylase subunit
MNLSNFKNNLFEAGTEFFSELGIRLNSNTSTSFKGKDILKEHYKDKDIFRAIKETYFLGLVDDSVFDRKASLLRKEKLTLQEADERISPEYNGLMIFAVKLPDSFKSTRTAISDLTRAFNRASKRIPVVLLLRYGRFITFAACERTKYKQQSREGEKVGKITLLKDINIDNPHTGHLKILDELRIGPYVYRQWQKVFDVQLLNRKFYQELANWYFWAVNEVEFPDDAEKDRQVRNATNVIRLITRLIFVWFIKEKGLVPDELFDPEYLKGVLNYTDKTGSTYYKAILQNLFFATLNTDMNKDTPGSRKFVNRQYGIHYFYRYERLFKDKKKALKLFEDIPFLNGGLFECLDKNVGKDNEIRIDCFTNSPQKSGRLIVPDKLFFSDEQSIDLNTIYGTRGKSYRVRGLINILKSYKFTIAENTPVEEEIALDPELLGKVFENLLASYNPETQTTARKQTGSFYTPREIVNYMVDESLIAYLSNALGNAPNPPLKLRSLLSYSEEPHGFSDAEVDTLINAIDNAKILDPACGSGAFPMGMLHKMVHILHKLDPDNAKWKQRQIDKVMEIPDVSVRDELLEDIKESFQSNELDYGRKLYLIENCIYGVDIQPIAVQIAKLRFFISLIVDQKIDREKKNLGIRPLPNLETKFVAANTLIGIDKPEQLMLRNPEIDVKEKELKQVREKHFSARTPKTKEKYRQEDARLRAELAELFKNDGFSKETTHKLANWDPYDQNASADFFDPEWMFGIKEGFDIVIGNPPYLRVQGLQQTQPEYVPKYKELYMSAKGSFDIYALFVEKGYGLLDDTGIFSYILPHKFFQAKFGQSLRKMLTSHKALRQIVRFGAEQVFEEATTYTCLLFLTKKPNEKFELFEVRTLNRGPEVLEAAQNRVEHPDYAFESLPEPDNTDWDFTIGEKNVVLTRIQQHPKRLFDITRKIFVGLQTSADKIYVLSIIHKKGDIIRCYSKHLDKEIEIEEGLVKPFLMGKDVHRYEMPVYNNVVIFPYLIKEGKAELMSQQYIHENYPKGWAYLRENEQALGNRERGRMHGDRFYAYIYPKNLTEFERVKIITPEIALGCQMTLDEKGELYHTTKVYSFVFKDQYSKFTKYYLGLLNSKVLWFFLKSTGYVLRGGYHTFKTEYLKPFPIPESTDHHEQIIEILVDYILYLKSLPSTQIKDEARHALMVAFFDQLIDCIVYELYFPEVFSDGSMKLSKVLPEIPLRPIKEIKQDIYSVLSELFEGIYKPNHAVRKCLYRIDTIDYVRVIEESTK